MKPVDAYIAECAANKGKGMDVVSAFEAGQRAMHQELQGWLDDLFNDGLEESCSCNELQYKLDELAAGIGKEGG